ncbi:helix-turn-helix domain-containing protein [Kitasatospora purpeofusca]|uniref:helix-turn-helix domain-containing protein n=1 Tax=Kitasatospora purpeofusca TaxID=67352 RepID=UPI001FC9F13D|nr:helix-turn-helix transcriptional regulator [Kitasatospora purpeofusca]
MQSKGGTVSHQQQMGATIRAARCARRMTQAQLGHSCGYSASAISRIENGVLRPGDQPLRLIARTLNLPLDVVRSPRPDTLAADVTAAQEDAMLRRQLLVAGMAAAGVSVLPSTSAAATPHDASARIVGALYEPEASAPTSLQELGRSLATARTHFTAARYRALGESLPSLLGTAQATRDELSGRPREDAHAHVSRAWVLATELALKSHSDVAWPAADRALAAAQASGHPVVHGEAARVLAITMRRAGRPSAAVDLLRRTADSLERDGDQVSRAVAATLLMTAAYTAACDRRRSDAVDLMTDAADTVRRLPGAEAGPRTPLFTVDATSTQVDLYWIGVHTALGTPDEAIAHAARISPGRLPTVERQARFGTDCARMWHHLGDHRRTFAALRFTERVAPEEVRRPALQALTADLLYAPVSIPGARELAARTGVTS